MGNQQNKLEQSKSTAIDEVVGIAKAYATQDRKYGSRRFFINNLSSLSIDTIKTYIADSCSTATNNGKNCKRSLQYENKGTKLNCTSYCIENKDKWLKDLFNYPKYVYFGINKLESKINGALYQFIEIKKNKSYYFDVVIDDNSIQSVNYSYTDDKYNQDADINENDNIDNLVKDIFLEPVSILNVLLITEKQVNGKITGFSDRLLKPTDKWTVNKNILILSILLPSGDVNKIFKITSPFLIFS